MKQPSEKPTQTPNNPNDVEQKPTPPVQTEDEQPMMNLST